MKPLMVAALLSASAVAFADAPKVQRHERKLDREARVYVMDKDVPSLDKTVAIARPRTPPASKDK